MQLAGFFVEYLIIGSFSIVWIWPLLYSSHIPLPENKAIVVLLAPSLYIIGMVIDVAGNFLTLHHRRRIRKRANKRYTERYGVAEIEHATVHSELLSADPNLAKEAAAKTSRSRVARGTLTNLICAVPVWLAVAWPVTFGWRFIMVATTGFLSIVACWGIWARWRRIAYRFEIKSLSQVRGQAADSELST